MRVLVFGTSEFAVPILDAVADRHEVVGVVTQPDRPAGRGHKLVATPVKRRAEELGLRVFTPERLKPFVDEARALAPDAFVVASYGRIVPQALLDVVPIAFNVHPSLLPLYRGATPLQSAIRDGRTETGTTIIAMDAGMDTGDVLLQEKTAIGPEETYGELHDRLARQGARMVIDAIDRRAAGTLNQVQQQTLGFSDDEVRGTSTRPLRKEDLIIDWHAPPEAIRNHVRSLAPEPLARTLDAHGQPMKIARVHTEPRSAEARPDFVLLLRDGTRVVVEATSHSAPFAAIEHGDTWIVLDTVVPAGKPEMDARRFAQMISQAQRTPAAVPKP